MFYTSAIGHSSFKSLLRQCTKTSEFY